MKCLIKYKWIKLPRDFEIDAKGLMTYYIRLATRVAFRKGTGRYSALRTLWSLGCGQVESLVSKAFWALRSAFQPCGS